MIARGGSLGRVREGDEVLTPLRPIKPPRVVRLGVCRRGTRGARQGGVEGGQDLIVAGGSLGHFELKLQNVFPLRPPRGLSCSHPPVSPHGLAPGSSDLSFHLSFDHAFEHLVSPCEHKLQNEPPPLRLPPHAPTLTWARGEGAQGGDVWGDFPRCGPPLTSHHALRADPRRPESRPPAHVPPRPESRPCWGDG